MKKTHYNLLENILIALHYLSNFGAMAGLIVAFCASADWESDKWVYILGAIGCALMGQWLLFNDRIKDALWNIKPKAAEERGAANKLRRQKRDAAVGMNCLFGMSEHLKKAKAGKKLVCVKRVNTYFASSEKAMEYVKKSCEKLGFVFITESESIVWIKSPKSDEWAALTVHEENGKFFVQYEQLQDDPEAAY